MQDFLMVLYPRW